MNEYKGIIISGDNDGEINYFGSKNDYHIDALVNYGLKKYPDMEIFQKMINCSYPDLPIYFLVYLDNIVYIDISEGRLGKRGMIFLPDEISDKQFNSLYEVASNINVLADVIYNMSYDDGLVSYDELRHLPKKTFSEMLDIYFNNYEKKI